mgnify:CR=1 FL=1
MEQRELLTVIVADDETELREAVCSVIPWKEIGFRLVGSAGNGLDALQLVEQLQPDLLLTDIRMPYISGVSLAQQVRELRPLTQIAFLSGYDDFAYAQKAIEYNVISYLLKPISMRELTEALAEIRGKIRRKFARLLPQKPEKSGWRELLLPLLLDGFAEEAQQDDPALLASLVGAGIPVMGHLGLTPQRAAMLGGFKAQARTAEGAQKLLEDALALEDAGCFAMVLECVPAPVAAAVSARLRIPTIGIGAGPDCDGQVLVFHDLLGLSDFRPRFAKAYADLGRVASEAVAEYAREVREGAFPAPEHCFSIRPEEWQAWQTRLEADSRANGKE